ncbi:hypothetical protein MNVM_41950 [Mycobacterium novum]|uniref:Uncharacterized protein n=1 Tax=Mycobacterium novum TaxID=2492438 RepID=A0A7I7JV46_9MYCO|nr:hypothetical protein MNVM_41950 [Mycobacterium novum]
MQAPHRDQGAPGRDRRQRRYAVLRVAAPQRHQEVGDVALAGTCQVVDAAGQQVLAVAAQIPPVGAQGVGGDPPLDRQMIQVALQLPAQRIDRLRRRRHDGFFLAANAVGRSTHSASTGRNVVNP